MTTSNAAAGFYPILPGVPPAPGGPEEVGLKAWNLMRMSAAQLPIPSAFVLPTAWYRRLQDPDAEPALKRALDSGIRCVETATGLRFASPRAPLLVSVRSGSAVSMPGMMETVLNVGLNAETVRGLIALTGNPRLAWDSYRRFVQNYSTVVSKLPREPFDQLLQQALSSAGVEDARDLDFRGLRGLTHDMLRQFEELSGYPFPSDPWEQLLQAVQAVFRSWDAPKSVAYRRVNQIDASAGTAATVQTMVFGNGSGASGSGVGFTRNPATGEPELYLDFQFNAQGEDVVAGQQVLDDTDRLRRALPALWTQLASIGRTLESLLRDVQDFEFTLQRGALFLLQSRAAKRTAWAAVRIAVDLVEEGLIQPRDALSMLAGIDLDCVARTRLSHRGASPLARAIPASVGCAAGAIALDSPAVERLARDQSPAILVRTETATEDIGGIAGAAGILTRFGGRTSHAAVVARQLGKVCLVGCTGLEIDLNRRTCNIGGRSFNEGDLISLDSNDGGVYEGRLQAISQRPRQELSKIAAWQAQIASRNTRASRKVPAPAKDLTSRRA